MNGQVDRVFPTTKNTQKELKQKNYSFRVIQHHFFTIQKNNFRPLVPFKEKLAAYKNRALIYLVANEYF